MKKFKIFLRFDKEEKWLEHMAEQGWLLSRKSLFYYFQKVVPETKTIRIDYREINSANDFLDYRTLFEDSGWKHIAGTKSSGTQYFLKIVQRIYFRIHFPVPEDTKDFLIYGCLLQSF